MTFPQAVQATPAVRSAYRRGLEALRRADAGRVQAENTQSLTGSLHLDEAFREAEPTASRWDYGIGYRHSRQEEARWVEVHPASADHVAAVLKKLTWLQRWLRNEAPHLARLTRGGFYWIATEGSVHISPGSPQDRRLAKAGKRGP